MLISLDDIEKYIIEQITPQEAKNELRKIVKLAIKEFDIEVKNNKISSCNVDKIINFAIEKIKKEQTDSSKSSYSFLKFLSPVQ